MNVTSPMLLLSIRATGAAFDDDSGDELARLLDVAAAQVRSGADEGELFDVNGNRVGSWVFGLVIDDDEPSGDVGPSDEVEPPMVCDRSESWLHAYGFDVGGDDPAIRR